MKESAKFFITQSYLYLIALVLLVSVSVVYFVLPKLEQEDICWVTASVISDDELYERAMKSYMQTVLDFKKDLKRSNQSCRAIQKDCDVWTGDYLNKVQVKNQIEFLIGYQAEQYEKILGIKSTNVDDRALKYQQSNNSFVYVDNLGGKASIAPSDCCSIASAKEVVFLKDNPNFFLWSKGVDLKELSFSKVRFLKVSKYLLPESHHFSSDAEFKKKSVQAVTYDTHFYKVNACGEVEVRFSSKQEGG